MRLPSIKVLVNTAIGVAVVGTGAVLYIQLRQMEEISKSTYFQEAFKLLRAHPGTYNISKLWIFKLINDLNFFFSGAIQYLGEPIKQLGYKIDDPENFLTSENAQFRVNVKGPNDKGLIAKFFFISDVFF